MSRLSARWKRPLAPAALLLALQALLSGCPGEVGAECELDLDCAEGLVCFAAICQELGEPEGTLTFEVSPPAATGLPPATFAMGSAASPQHFTFCAAGGVEGRLAAPAQVVASGEPAGLPGERRRLAVESSGDFRLSLPPGAWSLSFLFGPDETGLQPPPVRRTVQIPRCATLDLGEVAPAEETRLARFEVVFDPVLDPRPRCGAVAQLHAPGGEALSQPLLLEQEQGRSCEPPAGGWSLPFLPPAEGDEIELHLASADAALPTLAHHVWRFALPVGRTAELGVVGVGAESTLERLRIQVLDPIGLPVEGARVRASGTLSGDDSARFEPPLARELEPGSYELWLLPGTYTVEVEGPPGLHAARGRCLEPADGGPCEETLQVQPGAASSWTVRLPPPLRLSGRVAAADGSSVARARIRAFSTGSERRGDETVSSSGGSYELHLDPGEWEVLVQPGDPELPWSRFALDGPLVQDHSLSLQLPAPARVVGTVTATAQGETVVLPRSLVRAFRVDGDGGTRVVGEALTDSAGRFQLALPGGR